MPRWTDRGPYRLDLAAMLGKARDAVLARRVLVDQLGVLQDPPDLAAVIAAQREEILAGVSGLQSRADRTAFRLRDLLFASLASYRDQAQEAGFLATSIAWIGTTIETLETWDPGTLDQLPGEEAGTRAETLRQIELQESLLVATWRERYRGEPRELTALLQSPDVFLQLPNLMIPVSLAALFGSDPPNRAAVLDRELKLFRALETDMKNELELKLVRHAAAARAQREYRALEAEWESQQRETQAALENAVLAAVLTALNEAVTAATAPRMRAASLDGLRSALTDDKVIVTEAFGQLTDKLQERSEGSFGIAGPRGVGKTTLIRFLATRPGPRASRGAAGGQEGAGKPRLGVVVSAPVRYQPRDFVLYLYGEVCKKVIGPDADEALKDKIRDLYRDTSPAPGRAGQVLAAGAAILGAASVTGGAALLAWAIRHAVAASVPALAYAGAGLLASAALVLLIAVWRLLGALSWFELRIKPAEAELESAFSRMAGEIGLTHGSEDPGNRISGSAGTYSGAPSSSIGSLLPASADAFSRHAIWYFQYAAAAIVGGIALLLSGGGWPGGSWLLAGGIALPTAGAACLDFSRHLWPYRRLEIRLGRAQKVLESTKPSGAMLRELSLETLLQIRVQQGFASERTRSAAVTGPSVLPARFELDVKRGISWSEREKTYPELVADVRTFLGAVAEQYEVVIGIDELDKLRTADSVEDFLNDIKGVFGVPGCYYLVSVSEDAAAGFERRGAPFRDVFDSSFDDVISLQPLDLASARKILYGLLLGWTEPFIGLCFVLSGGLPRDLWRTAHELVAQRDRNNNDEIELGQAALALCRRDGEARLRAVRHELTRDSLDPRKAELLQLIAGLSFTSATPGDMLRWHEDLRAWSTRPAAADDVAPGIPPGDATALRAGSPAPATTASAMPAARLALETAAYLLFAASVLQFFVPELIADRLNSDGTGAKAALALAALASSRQSLALSPASSLAATEQVRREWDL